jgi:indolepyruvate decarboxylase
MNPEVRAFVESCDCLLDLGTLLTDANSGGFTARIDPAKRVQILHHQVRIGTSIFEHVEMKDVLLALIERLPRKTESARPEVEGSGEPQGLRDDPITADYLYPRWSQCLKPGDIVIADTGTVAMGMAFVRLPAGSTFHSQTLWGSIGWATAAAFGAALADPGRRVVLFTGEGAHQCTAQEISQFPRYGLKPLIFVLNNHGYLTERLFCPDPNSIYNDLALWNYRQLPQALGCTDWLTARVATCGELDQVIDLAETSGSGAYIEVVTDPFIAPPLPMKMHELRKARPYEEALARGKTVT